MAFSIAGKDLVAVEERVHPVALQQGRAEQHAHGALELRIGDVVRVRERVLDRLFGRGEEVHAEEDQHRGRDEEEGDLPCERRYFTTP
jgi:hypothetical protein